LLASLAADVADFGHVDGGESFEGRNMTVLLSPNGASR
jgi:translation initiation factor IF-3